MSKNKTMTQEQMQAEIARLQAENQKLKATKAVGGLKITQRKPDGTGSHGALSCYGLGRFPVTLYKSQWIELLTQRAPEILAFIEAHASELAEKPVKVQADADVEVA